jgi:hypothetical protein
MAEMMKVAVVHEFRAPLRIEEARIPAAVGSGRTRNGGHRSDAFAR